MFLMQPSYKLTQANKQTYIGNMGMSLANNNNSNYRAVAGSGQEQRANKREHSRQQQQQMHRSLVNIAAPHILNMLSLSLSLFLSLTSVITIRDIRFCLEYTPVVVAQHQLAAKCCGKQYGQLEPAICVCALLVFFPVAPQWCLVRESAVNRQCNGLEYMNP